MTWAMKQKGLSESCAHPDCPFAVTDSGAYGGFCCKRGSALHGAFLSCVDVFHVFQSDKPLVYLAVLCEDMSKNCKSQIRADAINLALSA